MFCVLKEEFEDTKRGNQNPYIEEEQTTQWPKEKVQKDQYSRACGSYQDFLDRGLLLTRKLLNQGFLFSKVEIITSNMLRHHDLVDRYGTSVSQMTTDMFHLSQTLPGPFLIHDLLPGL
jgi:hypothetical protein